MHDPTTGDNAGVPDLGSSVALLESRVAVLESRLAAVAPDRDSGSSVVTTGELLRRRRRDLRQTQAVAALIMGVNQATVSKWERGNPMRMVHLVLVAAYVGVHPAELLGPVYR